MKEIVKLLRTRNVYKQRVEDLQGQLDTAQWNHDKTDEELQRAVLKIDDCKFLIGNVLYRIIAGQLTVETLESFTLEVNELDGIQDGNGDIPF